MCVSVYVVCIFVYVYVYSVGCMVLTVWLGMCWMCDLSIVLCMWYYVCVMLCVV